MKKILIISILMMLIITGCSSDEFDATHPEALKLTDQIANLENKVMELETKIEESNDEIDALHEELDLRDERIAFLENELELANEQIAQMQTNEVIDPPATEEHNKGEEMMEAINEDSTILEIIEAYYPGMDGAYSEYYGHVLLQKILESPTEDLFFALKGVDATTVDNILLTLAMTIEIENLYFPVVLMLTELVNNPQDLSVEDVEMVQHAIDILKSVHDAQ